MKATMMKISDPIIFGHCVNAYYKDALEEHADALAGTQSTRHIDQTFAVFFAHDRSSTDVQDGL